MARFYEEYGHIIFRTLTAGLGIAISYWGLLLAGHLQQLPPYLSIPLICFDEALSAAVSWGIDFVEKRLQWFGGLATLATFSVGLVSGIRQAKRQLPRRLIDFMNEKVQPVHDNTDALLAAMSPRMIDLNRRTQFHRERLEHALTSLQGGYRPSKRSTLEVTINEVDKAIKVTVDRLRHLNDIGSHARLLRGIFVELESAEGRRPDKDKAAEADYTTALENEATRLAALELRGLSRARDQNHQAALEDFARMEREANKANATRTRARALRHSAEVMRHLGQIRHLLNARKILNQAKELFNAGIAHTDADWEEMGLNRETYGMVQKAIAGLTETKTKLALSSLVEAKQNYGKMKRGSEEHIKRVSLRISELNG